MSSSSLLTFNDKVKISSCIAPELKTSFAEALKIIKKSCDWKVCGCCRLGKTLTTWTRYSLWGLNSYEKKSTKNQCNFNGELYGFKNFYIADSASMPFLASKGHSFNSMVNAYYIARKVLYFRMKRQLYKYEVFPIYYF